MNDFPIPPIAPEFSRPVNVDKLRQGKTSLDVEATEAEREALAQRFELLSLDKLSARLVLTKMGGGKLVRLDAHFTATAVQSCVVTLEPLPVQLADDFTLTYGLEEERVQSREVIVGEEDDPPEPIIDGLIDVGEAVAEHLSLALDPFPRKEGVAMPEKFAPRDDDVPHPFAKLAALKDKLK